MQAGVGRASVVYSANVNWEGDLTTTIKLNEQKIKKKK